MIAIVFFIYAFDDYLNGASKFLKLWVQIDMVSVCLSVPYIIIIEYKRSAHDHADGHQHDHGHKHHQEQESRIPL